VTGGGQAPAPSQVAAAVAVPLEQLASRQLVLESGYAHAAALAPLQAPPHAPLPLQAVRAPCGGPLTATHRPTLPWTSHASHWPLQARSQQKPSAQVPLAHSFAAAQAYPSAFFDTQAPAAPQ
jgi:hypothetical protein